MKKIILAALLAISTLTASAQADAGTFSIVPQVGVNVASTTGDGAKGKVGFLAGVEGVYQASDSWAFSVGAFYANEGAKAQNDMKMNVNNLNIPVLANCYVASGLAIKAGVQPAINLSSKMEGLDMKPITKSFAVSVPVGLSYEFSNVVLDARYNFGVTDMFDRESSAKNNTFQFTVGYKF